MVNESGLKSKALFKDMISDKEWHVNKTKDGNYAIMEPEHAAIYIIRRTYPFKDNFFPHHNAINRALDINVDTLIAIQEIHCIGSFWEIDGIKDTPYFNNKFFKYLDTKHLSFKLSPDGKLLYVFDNGNLIAIIAGVIPRKEKICLT